MARIDGPHGGRRGAEGAITGTPLLELSSIDMKVTFFGDHLEYRRRLGSKHGAVPYNRIQAVDMAERSWPAMRASADDIFEAPPTVTKMMVLTVTSRRRPVTFDFRSEPSRRIQDALDVVNKGVNLAA